MSEPKTSRQEAARAEEIAQEHYQSGRMAEAEHWFRRAVSLDPSKATLHFNLAVTLQAAGRYADALESFRRAIGIEPALAEAHFNAGNLLKQFGRLAEAEAAYRTALQVRPDYVEAFNNLGIVLADAGRLDEAAAAYRDALLRKPVHASSLNNLGNLLRELGGHEEAEGLYRRTLELRPDLPEVWTHYANALLDLGRHGEAERAYRHAADLAPSSAAARSNLLFMMNYEPRHGPATLREEAEKFGAQQALRSRTLFPNARSSGRKLRIGYVSADFRAHSVAMFFEPVIENHDRARFEIFCYSNSARSDGVTSRLRSRAAAWRDVWALDDEACATRICEDEIDILVDLSGHTSGNRLPVFARKPAPVQVTYLGYPSTSGLSAMDYRITDARADPPGASDALHTERLFRLDRPMWCFRPGDDLPSVGPTQGGLMFGSFNYFGKINDAVVAAWAALLRRLPEARLTVTRLPGPKTADQLLGRFAEAGVARDRIVLHGILPRARLMTVLESIDIALDPFPYAGTTTTCELLWAGIPVVTLAGLTSASRSGASLLGAVALDGLVARSADEYVDLACRLAGDWRDLSAIRAGLRARMRASPLLDESGFTQALEGAYRSMWQVWCG